MSMIVLQNYVQQHFVEKMECALNDTTKLETIVYFYDIVIMVHNAQY